jgi:hypothetical protein
MDILFLEFTGEPLQFAGYLDQIDPDCGELIMQRLGLLDAFAATDPLPDPPISPLAEISGLSQLLVDYEGEVHRVAFGAHAGVWLVVRVFRCDKDPIPALDVSAIRSDWADRP